MGIDQLSYQSSFIVSAFMNVADVAIELIDGIGPSYAKRLNKLGIFSLFDLLLFLPRTYESHKVNESVANLDSGDKSVVTGRVLEQSVKQGRRRMLSCLLDCKGESVALKFFHFYPSQLKTLSVGNVVRATGNVRKSLGFCEMIHPRIELIDSELAPSSTFMSLDVSSSAIEPVYPLTEGINNQNLKKFMAVALGYLNKNNLAELLPTSTLERYKWEDINAALNFVHQPSLDAVIDHLKEMRHPLQQRLSFEELLAHRLALKLAHDDTERAPRLLDRADLVTRFLQLLPYQMTNAQARCFDEIKKDLERDRPMLRLLQGDVGAGKTLVAQLASLLALENSYQVAFMAPTEILAQQHFEKTQALFSALGIKAAFLVGKLSAKIKRELYAGIAAGEYQMIIGTHALIQTGLQFHRLGLVIIDEQHRFGVDQRLRLQQKGAGGLMPHQLIMTATPIPRTLAMSVYADLDVSVIDQLPAGRKPIQTTLLSQERRDDLIQRLSSACASGRQAYWVCPLIEESEVLELEAAETTYQRLLKDLPHLRIGLLHGRIKGPEKAKIMAAFKAHEFDLLVATTVIEVGVDVPNASIMVIENPERMGLSQLHQLRGRVGRGGVESFCILLYQAPISPSSFKRLQVVRDHHDGFYLAEEDLKFRGSGEFLGTRQTGGIHFRLASLLRDAPMLQMVNQTAVLMQIQYPEQVQALVQRWFAGKVDFIRA